MATVSFLKLDGIPGESADAQHAGEIDVEAWSWGENNTPPAGSGSGSGSGRVRMEDLAFTARFSKASPALLLACASGRHLRSAVLTATHAGEPRRDVLIVSLSDVVVSTYETSTGEDDASPRDSVSLHFAKIQVEYRPLLPNGSLGPPVKVGWDVERNAPL